MTPDDRPASRDDADYSENLHELATYDEAARAELASLKLSPREQREVETRFRIVLNAQTRHAAGRSSALEADLERHRQKDQVSQRVRIALLIRLNIHAMKK